MDGNHIFNNLQPMFLLSPECVKQENNECSLAEYNIERKPIEGNVTLLPVQSLSNTSILDSKESANFTLDESKCDLLDVLSKIDNAYGLSIYEISEFRNLLLKKMTIRELKSLFAIVEGTSDQVEINVTSVIKKKRRMSQPIRTPKKKLNKKNRYLPLVQARETEMFSFGSLLIGHFKCVPIYPISNSLTICHRTSKMFYEIHYAMAGEWYKTIISVGIENIESFSRSGPCFILKLSCVASVEGSYRSGHPYFPDIAWKEIQSSRVHQLEFTDSAHIYGMEAVLNRIIVSNRNIQPPSLSSSMEGSIVSKISELVSKSSDEACSSASSTQTTATMNSMANLEALQVPNFTQNQIWDNSFSGRSLALHYASSYRDMNVSQLFQDTREPDMSYYNITPVFNNYTQDSNYCNSLNSVATSDSQYILNSLQGNNIYLSDPFVPYISQTFNSFDSTE